MKGEEMPVGDFELKPKRRTIWAWPNRFLTPKRDPNNGQRHFVTMFFRMLN